MAFGRPPIGLTAMTPAQRKRRSREQQRLAQSAQQPESDDQGNAFDAQPQRPPPCAGGRARAGRGCGKLARARARKMAVA
jgi:hypothetical protein